MPNHVTTRCLISGSSERIEAFKQRHIRAPSQEASRTDEVCLDFNTVIPMPELLRGTESGSDTDFGLFALGHPPKYSSPLNYEWVKDLGITTREEFRAWLEKDRPEAIKKAELALQAKAETGHTSWYDWSIENWGTKWNSYSFQILSDRINTTPEEVAHPVLLPDRCLEIRFDTAWSFPEPVFKKLAELWPDLRFVFGSFDEGWNFALVGAASNGHLAVQSHAADDQLYEAVYGEPPERELPEIEDKNIQLEAKDVAP